MLLLQRKPPTPLLLNDRRKERQLELSPVGEEDNVDGLVTSIVSSLIPALVEALKPPLEGPLTSFWNDEEN